jgi:hypothetical protein
MQLAVAFKRRIAWYSLICNALASTFSPAWRRGCGPKKWLKILAMRSAASPSVCGDVKERKKSCSNGLALCRAAPQQETSSSSATFRSASSSTTTSFRGLPEGSKNNTAKQSNVYAVSDQQGTKRPENEKACRAKLINIDTDRANRKF